MIRHRGPQLAPETEFLIIEEHMHYMIARFNEVLDKPVSTHTEREFNLVQAVIDADNMELINLAQKAHGFWP